MSTTTNIAAVTLTDDLFQTPMYLVESPYDEDASGAVDRALHLARAKQAARQRDE